MLGFANSFTISITRQTRQDELDLRPKKKKGGGAAPIADEQAALITGAAPKCVIDAIS